MHAIACMRSEGSYGVAAGDERRSSGLEASAMAPAQVLSCGIHKIEFVYCGCLVTLVPYL